MRKNFLTLSLLLFAFSILGLVHFHKERRGGGLTDTNIQVASQDDQALDNKWNELKNGFATYPGFKSNSVDIGSTAYTFTDLWTKSIDPTNPAGSTFVDDAKAQLQALVDNSIGWTAIKNELDEANNEKLDVLWSELKTALADYNASISYRGILVTVDGAKYSLDLLVDSRENDIAGRDLDAPIKVQLQALVNKRVVAQSVKDALADKVNADRYAVLSGIWDFSWKQRFQTYSRSFFTKPITIRDKGSFAINHLLSEKHNEFSALSVNARIQFQTLFDSSVNNFQLETALVIANTANNTALDTLWSALKTSLADYAGHIFTTPIDIDDEQYTINLLITNKGLTNTDGKDLNTAQGKDQLQALVNGGITDATAVRTALDTANAANNTALDTLWSGLKTALADYAGHNFTTPIDISGSDYTIDLLITNKADPLSGSTLTSAKGQAQLQKLVNGGITDATAVRTALNTANNNRNLDNLWTTLKTALAGYTGYNFEDVDVEVSGNNYRLNLLIDNKDDPLSGSTLTSAKGQGQLQALVDGGVAAADVRSALDTANTANDTALDTLWTTLKTALADYTGHTFTTPIDISGSDYTINLLITNKADPLSGSTLTSAKGQDQLQKLVNAGITDANTVRTALNTANNNKKLDDLWTALKTALAGYTGYNFEDVDVEVSGNNYRLNLLIDHKADRLSGSTLTPEKGKVQLQALVDGGVAAADVRTTLNAKNTANNTALDTLWSGLKTALADYAGHTFTTPIDISGSDYTIDLLITNKADPLSGSTLTSAKGQAQLQKLVNGGITDATAVRTALNTANNNRNLDNLWTALKTALVGYTGYNFEDVDVEVGGTNYRLNLLIDHKADRLSGSTLTSAKGQGQLQALVNGGVAAADVRSALNAKNTANNTALDTLWSRLKTALADYAGHTFTTPIDISGSDYTINLLITNKGLDSTAGTALTDAQGQKQLQKLVNGGITDANAVRTALNTANNNRNLDNLWTALKTALAGYTGYNFEDVDVEVSGTNYRLNLLIDHKADPLSGSTLTPEKGKVQLQALVDGGVVAADVRTALNAKNTANNTALDTLWSRLKTALADYAGHTFTTPIDINGSDYTINLLITNKADPLSGSTLTSAKGQGQLQKLVNGGITDATAVRTALNTANNNRNLDNLWTTLKTALAGYTGYNFEDVDVEVSGNNYKLNLLIDNKADPLSGSTLTNAKGQAQLQALVDGGVAAADVRSALNAKNTANNTALDTLWSRLKTALADYAGHTFTTPIDISGSDYTINLLITNKRLATAGHSLADPIKAQLQNLVNGGITDAAAVRTALDTANNNKKLDDLWTDILDLFNRRGGSFAGNQIIIKGNSYPFKEIAYAASVILPNNPSGSSLTTDIKIELQTLVNAGITAKDIETYLDSLKKQAEETKEEESTKNQYLAIGLGIAGGVLALAGVGGFAYWFLKIRKS